MIERVLGAWSDEAAEFASVLHEQDPSWRSEAFPLAGGHAVLWGAGLFVNRAMAAGVDASISDDEFELLESRSRAVGVEPAIEVSPATRPDARLAAERRGYVAAAALSALRCRLTDAHASTPDPSYAVVGATDQLAVWQEVAALGWGHEARAARRASDAFAAAAAVIDGDGFVLARDGDRPIGCASLNVTAGVATLRGMSTVPAERRRGVQAALIHHRLQLAHAAGCDVATTTVRPGGDSERNLRRHGFEPWFTITILTRTGIGASG